MAENEKKKNYESQPLRVVLAGHVDHGKSTLIGRLLRDAGSLPEGKFEELKSICEARSEGVMEWSYLLDVFQAERDQAVTIDTTHIPLKTADRSFTMIDAPGHREFIKNMMTGSAQADAAILVVDAKEGIQEQTHKHMQALSFLEVSQIVIVINKMDSVDHAQDVFDALSADIHAALKKHNLKSSHIIPVCARDGDMVVEKSSALKWYDGATLLEALHELEVPNGFSNLPLRFPVQDVYRINEKRVLVGRLETGAFKVGDTLLFSPSNEEAKVASVEVWPNDASKTEAFEGEAIGITLDDHIFIERGAIASNLEEPPILSNMFSAQVFWFSEAALKIGDTYTLSLGTSKTSVNIQDIKAEGGHELSKNQTACVTLRSRNVLALDAFDKNSKSGRFVMTHKGLVVGVGKVKAENLHDLRNITPKANNIRKVRHLLSREAREENKGHKGAVFWLTGLSGSGKSTLAMAAEKILFEKGLHTYVLDGDNIRHGLNQDLGFSPEDRAENIRRIGEVAALMADAGLITISAFISPFEMDRDHARMASAGHFHEIHVAADIETCERRDPKGLYKKARAGEIEEFTGIDSPYEAPANPEMIVDTQKNDIDTCVDQLVRYIEKQVELKSEYNTSTSKEKIIAQR